MFTPHFEWVLDKLEGVDIIDTFQVFILTVFFLILEGVCNVIKNPNCSGLHPLG